jgi:predicted site-specific integrase-resolvase
MEETKMISVAEVAARLYVHPTTVMRWVRLGHFPGAYKVGPAKNSPYIIPESAVVAFEKARQEQVVSSKN